jgi:hypothetical protein
VTFLRGVGRDRTADTRIFSPSCVVRGWQEMVFIDCISEHYS